MWKWLFSFLLDQRGEDDGGQDDSPADKGGQDNITDKKPDEGGAGLGEDKDTPPATPKYGDFGDTPTVDQIFEAFNKQKGDIDALSGDHEVLKGKTTATEQNLANLRKSLDGAGIKVYTDETGNVKFSVKEDTSSGRKKRFTAEHQTIFNGLFDKEGGSALNALIDDKVEEGITKGIKTYHTSLTQKQQFNSTRDNAVDEMFTIYPSLLMKADGKPNPEFNKKFYDRTTEIWKARYPKNPEGELFAAQRAAIELGISPGAVEGARKDGYKKGKADKKIIGAVGGGSAGKGGSGFRKLSKEERAKLSHEERDKYDLLEVEKGR